MKLKLTIFLIFISLLLGVKSYGQTNYYYYKGEKIPLSLDLTNLTLITSENFQLSSIKNSNIEKTEYLPQNNGNNSDVLRYIQLKLKNNIAKNVYQEALSQLKRNIKIKQVIPNYITPIGKGIGMSDYFYVKLKNANDYDKLIQLSKEKRVEIVERNKFMPLWFTLRCTTETKNNTLELANSFFESGLFSSAVPDFLYDDLLCANDADFNQLWGLNNNQNPNIDINACDAWNITEGNGINVAVLDQGIELTHDDLQDNISQNSYDTESNSSPSQVFGFHGTHVAGTIAAIKDNSLQVVGVAPQATLISVSNSLDGTPNSRIKRADGINWAWQNGADIISNSWGSAVQYDMIDDAIENALTSGRNGLGTIVVFATGNDFGAVGYPANSNPDILSVGSITSNGDRSNFSNFGNQLDVVAPGSGILSTITNNGTDTFSGTSMATPHVSGIAALILSENPNLTFQQVNDIIENTAQKIPNYSYSNTTGRPNGTWNSQVGYGLVDAFAAVQQASVIPVPSKPNIHDFTFVWSGPSCINYNWQTISFGVQKNSSNGCSLQSLPENITEVEWNIIPSKPINTTLNSGIYRCVTSSVVNAGVKVAFSRPSNPYVTTFLFRVKGTHGWSDWSVGNYHMAQSCNHYNYSVYPNPTSETLTIQKQQNEQRIKANASSTNKNTTFDSYKLYDFDSSLISKGKLSNQTSIDVSTYKKGRYVLKIKLKDKSETHHIIVK